MRRRLISLPAVAALVGAVPVAQAEPSSTEVRPGRLQP